MIFLAPSLLASLSVVTNQNSSLSAQSLPSLQRTVYEAWDGDPPNPARGFYSWPDDFSLETLTRYASSGYFLAYLRENLDSFRQSDLPTSYLNELGSKLINARQARLKVILRFTYNEGPDVPIPAPDAPLNWVLRHIQQLGPVLERYKEVIAWFEAGFIGVWGEWHTSTHGLDHPENKLRIRNALFVHFPKDRFILFRYPADLISWFPRPLSHDQAFQLSIQARSGFHNDCFLADAEDRGTYLMPPDFDRNMIREFQTYLSQATRFVPVSGETCDLNQARNACPVALKEIKLMHWSALNEAYHPDVIKLWKTQGCYPLIRRRLGYRLSLLEVRFPSRLRPQDRLVVEIKLKNEGFAAPLLHPQAYLVLTRGTQTEMVLLSVDPRRWEPGQHEVRISHQLPSNLPSGEYNLALWVPDSSENLRSIPQYSIRLLNKNTWDEQHGWNVLGTVQILP